jgi:hypothetical protein
LDPLIRQRSARRSLSYWARVEDVLLQVLSDR